jgi:hypothetical protein
LLTNYKRYTPRWYQEAIAVLIETWFSGGYGRLLGSFDEMYFRTLVLEEGKFLSQLEVETLASHNTMFLETIFYLYGARFVTFLSINYSSEKILEWFKAEEGNPYIGFESKFEQVFGRSFSEGWKEFIEFEKSFEKENIKLLKSSPTTKVTKIGDDKFGWVTQPYFDRHTNTVIFGYHRPHQLATLNRLNLFTGSSSEIATLPTPSMLQVV